MTLEAGDIVRHRLVQDIVGRYESARAARGTVDPSAIAGSTMSATPVVPSERLDAHEDSEQNSLD